MIERMGKFEWCAAIRNNVAIYGSSNECYPSPQGPLQNARGPSLKDWEHARSRRE